MSLGAVQSASASNSGGCAAAHDQILVDLTTAAGMVDPAPYIDPANPRYLGDVDVIAAFVEFIGGKVDKNDDGLVCVDYRRPVNKGTDKQWGVADYQLLSLNDNTSMGR